MEASAVQVLVIEDDPTLLRTLTMILNRNGYATSGAASGQEGLELLRSSSFDVVITDVKLKGGMDGLEVLELAVDMHKFCNKMIVMTGYEDSEAPIRAIRLGVDDYIYKPFRLEQLLRAVGKSVHHLRLQRDAEHGCQLATKDALTGLFNHRYFHEVFQRELSRAERYGHVVSLLALNIDDFSRLNDTHGYLIGDIVLKNMAKTIFDTVRATDVCFRYGGEEFFVIFPESTSNEALRAAERLRVAIEAQSLPERVRNEKKDESPATVSIGIATFPEDGKDREGLIGVAEMALRAAKASGKNCIRRGIGS